MGDVERMSASSDLSPEFTLSLDDGSFVAPRSRIGSCSMSDTEDGDAFSVRLNRSFSSWTLFNRSSSVYTDSSEDLASLTGDEGSNGSSLMRRLEYGEKDIGKIVDYFERYIRSGGDSASAVAAGRTVQQCVTSCSNLKARIRQFQNWRQNEEKLGRDKLLASQLSERLAAVSGLVERAPPAPQLSQPPSKKQVAQRLKVCEGAVQSKLSLFDKKVNSVN